jgi:integral membrane sensor domain MASE1
MLVSASTGMSSLMMFKVLPMQDAGAPWLSWWAGDFVGVLLAAPLLLNISCAELKKLWAQRGEFSVWCMTTLAISWGVFFSNINAYAYSQPLVFMVLPIVVWSAMRFGMTGSSLGVLLPVLIATLATGRGLGPFIPRVPSKVCSCLAVFFHSGVGRVDDGGLAGGAQKSRGCTEGKRDAHQADP